MTPGTLALDIPDGVVIVASDCHYRPDEPASTAHRALVELTSRYAEEGSLSAVILNGDVADFPKISKHTRIMWEPQPAVADELAIVRHRMPEIAEIAGCATSLAFTIGNHDQRISSRLSAVAPGFEGVPGFDLRDHIEPKWTIAWQVEINGPQGVLVRHRLKGGAGAGRANVIAAGRSVVTGHMHQLNSTRVSNCSGHHWGIDAGCIAALNSKAFTGYTEAAAGSGLSNWASGFAVLTFSRGVLLPPELIMMLDEEAGLVAFRGEIIRVRDAANLGTLRLVA